MMFKKGSMRQLLNSRKMLIAMSMIIILVTVVFPTCRMIGCSMEMGPRGAMPISMHMMHGMAPLDRIVGNCGGTYVASDTFEGLAPTGFEALILALMVALVVGIVSMGSRLDLRIVAVAYATPPPPPLEPRGERFRI